MDASLYWSDLCIFKTYSRARVVNWERTKDEMSSAKVRGRNGYSARVGGLGVTQTRVTAFAVPRSSNKFSLRLLRQRILVHRAFLLQSYTYVTLTLLTPSPLRNHFEHATFISTRNNPHNTQQTCPTTATTAAVTLAPASTSSNLSTPQDALANTPATENTMPTCWKRTTIKSTT